MCLFLVILNYKPNAFKTALQNKYGSDYFLMNMELNERGWLMNIFISAHPYNYQSVLSENSYTSMN